MTELIEPSEFSRTREALFNVKTTIADLEAEEKHIMVVYPVGEMEPSDTLWLAGKKEMGVNFKRVVLEELDTSIERLAKIRNRLSEI